MERENSTKEKMAQILSCRICLERLVSPKTLTCDHIYCQTCLEDLFVAGENKLICPVCRKDQCNVTKVEAIKDLPTNLYVKQSLEVLYGEGVFTEKRQKEENIFYFKINCSSECFFFVKCFENKFLRISSQFSAKIMLYVLLLF